MVKQIDSESHNVIVYVVPRLRMKRKAKTRDKMHSNIDLDEDSFVNNDIDINSSRLSKAERKREFLGTQLDSTGRPLPRLFNPKDYNEDDVTQIYPLAYRQTGHSEIDGTDNYEHR